MKFLLTGCRGQLGWELERSLRTLGKVISCGRETLDLSDPGQIVTAVRDVMPDVIVNAAAYTAVDAAEDDFEAAMAINGAAPGILAEEAKRLGALLVHYSTDYVFDGTKKQPYVEEDAPNPVNVYGSSKLAGEAAIFASDCRFLVFRTSWVYSPRGKNFLLTMLRLTAQEPELRVVDDQFGAPTLAHDIASTTCEILKRQDSPQGIYHLSAGGRTTWYGFAQAIVAEKENMAKLLPVPTSSYPTRARRPRNSVLDNSKLKTHFGLAVPDWTDGLRRCLEHVER